MSGVKGQGMRHPEPDDTYAPGLADPAKGAKVPRCAICGLPNQSKNPLLPGFWRYASREGIDLAICELDYLARLPDAKARLPITLDEVA